MRCAIVTGAGDRAFSAGADIRQLNELSSESALAFMAYGQRVFDRIAASRKPTVAAVNGYALGGGLELAMACDIRIASDTAFFGQPEITLGSIPGWGGTQRLPLLIGLGRARELILTGRIIDAAEAERAGLRNESFPSRTSRPRLTQLGTNHLSRPSRPRPRQRCDPAGGGGSGRGVAGRARARGANFRH